ncbi:MAG: hypothetical protein IH602_07480 [Bryobacteraceae bacterium]|nr:hypothetical protein [Bryobacteraceae bacterium]
MQTLGITDSTPRTENRLKSLFWPSIKDQGDADYLTIQGFWVCFVTCVITLIVGLIGGEYFGSLFAGVFYLLGGAGVRQGSRFAAVSVFAVYLLSCIGATRHAGMAFDALTVILIALLLANVRSVFLSARWAKSGLQVEIPRLSTTLGDKLSDQFPKWVWPKGRYAFYVMAVLLVLPLLFVVLMPSA